MSIERHLSVLSLIVPWIRLSSGETFRSKCPFKDIFHQNYLNVVVKQQVARVCLGVSPD